MPPPLRAIKDQPDEETTDVHPLFAGAHAVKPLKAPIEAIDVMRIVRGKQKFLKWLPADDLPDEESILFAFGPGDYELVGRGNERKQIISRTRISVGDNEEEEDDTPAIATPEPEPQKANASELFSLFERMQQSRDREAAEQRAREQQLVATTIAAIQQSANTTLQAVTLLANARIADQKEMMAAFASQKNSQMPGQMMTLVREAFETGRSMQTDSGSDDGDSEIMGHAIAALIAMMQGRPPTPPAPPAPPQTPEGELSRERSWNSCGVYSAHCAQIQKR